MSPYTIPMLWNARCSITDQSLVSFKTEIQKIKKNIYIYQIFFLPVSMHKGVGGADLGAMVAVAMYSPGLHV